MSKFCCRTFRFSDPPDLAGLYGAICAAVPSCYAYGQGFSNDCLRFLLDNGVKVELYFRKNCCEIWLSGSGQEQLGNAAVYGPMFEELVMKLRNTVKETVYGRR